MTPEEFAAAWSKIDRIFDGDWHEVIRLEVHQDYAVPGEEAALQAWRQGLPRPVWSVRTDPWLARIAVTTASKEHPKHWKRCRIIEHPLTEYTRYELTGYTESQAAGEEIVITDRAADASLDALHQDFWLFDGDGPGASAIIMRYDREGHWLGAEHTRDPAVLARCVKQRDAALRYSVPLNEYLAPAKEHQRAA